MAHAILSEYAEVYTLERFLDYLSNELPKQPEQIALFDRMDLFN